MQIDATLSPLKVHTSPLHPPVAQSEFVLHSAGVVVGVSLGGRGGMSSVGFIVAVGVGKIVDVGAGVALTSAVGLTFVGRYGSNWVQPKTNKLAKSKTNIAFFILPHLD